jgi:hypothetical protein
MSATKRHLKNFGGTTHMSLGAVGDGIPYRDTRAMG